MYARSSAAVRSTTGCGTNACRAVGIPPSSGARAHQALEAVGVDSDGRYAGLLDRHREPDDRRATRASEADAEDGAVTSAAIAARISGSSTQLSRGRISGVSTPGRFVWNQSRSCSMNTAELSNRQSTR